MKYQEITDVMTEQTERPAANIEARVERKRLKRNESVSTHTIEMFCKILDCEVGDIMQYIRDEET